ncbi:hypothetical protein CLG85_010130 [Yangia mangrovi]|uniref:Uncharacterized protein n=1 Tax=Alloyangia mangrovi TaxID=1779329 RepID=A0ABT2KJX5_9RHOB|nr:hypothetical protein [Alloyangia mangrovi]MCT4370658.1 hypothetical protein [Alloyangia mangrovi]
MLDRGLAETIGEHPVAGTALPFRVCAHQAGPALMRREIFDLVFIVIE